MTQRDAYKLNAVCWDMIQKSVEEGNMKKAIKLLTWARNLAVEIANLEANQIDDENTR